ncbi:MAG: ATP-dependent RNA helicase HrpA, partial [Burkholderiales bacterium]
MEPQNIIPWLEQINNLPINQMYKQFWHNQLTQTANKADKFAKLIEQLQAYLTCCANKQYLHQLTQVSYPANLPVSQEIEQIKAQVLNHQVVIICGETGSGKTTQLPKMLFELGLANYATIGHTQPRKVAAKSLAKRIGEELTNPDLVGYKVRFQNKTKPNTSIKLMTDGILLQEIQTDKYLFQYSAIIIDEAHERSLNIDFILGYLKTILPKRPDLKLIITSATIENTKLAKFFDQAPIINVAGKTYPVDIIYQPIETEANNLNQAIYTAIKSCLSIEHGNILVFLPGEREIKDCISFLRKSTVGQYQLLALFSRQNEAEQAMVFKEDKRLKIIVTTNVAETSLTIPGIRFVIDSGLARLKRYNSRNKVEQLQIEKISQASSKQRAGRAGRVSHGMCIRLFAEDDFKLRPEFTDPEILRSNLANVILKLINFKLGDPLHFPFLDQPDDKAFTDGYRTLYQLGALTDKNLITPSGRQIAQIAVDANLAKMLLAAGSQFNCLKEILIIVAFLAIAEPREYPLEWQQQAKEKHQLWANKQSDFMAILNLWHWYHNELAHKKSKKKLLDKCREQFVSLMRLREWHELYGQLKESLHNLNYKESGSPASYQQIHQALLIGLLNNIGQKDLVEGFYLGTNNKKFFLHPNSFIDKPKWLCSAQLTQTTRLYARTNAYIEPQWLIPLTAHLVKYTYS